MYYCTSCGQALEEGMEICPMCGVDVGDMIRSKESLRQKQEELGWDQLVAERNVQSAPAGQMGQTVPPRPGAYAPPPSPGTEVGNFPQEQAGYMQQPYMQQPYGQGVKQPNGLGTASGIMGILTILVWVVILVISGLVSQSGKEPGDPFFMAIGMAGVLNIIAALAGLVMGIIAATRANRTKGWAVAGIICNGLTVFLLLLGIVAAMVGA